MAKIYNNEVFDNIIVDDGKSVLTIGQIKEKINNGSCPIIHVNVLLDMLRSTLKRLYRNVDSRIKIDE